MTLRELSEMTDHSKKWYKQMWEDSHEGLGQILDDNRKLKKELRIYKKAYGTFKTKFNCEHSGVKKLEMIELQEADADEKFEADEKAKADEPVAKPYVSEGREPTAEEYAEFMREIAYYADEGCY
jgi:hypothetical protein